MGFDVRFGKADDYVNLFVWLLLRAEVRMSDLWLFHFSSRVLEFWSSAGSPSHRIMDYAIGC
jgi:hypothetical protein